MRAQGLQAPDLGIDRIGERLASGAGRCVGPLRLGDLGFFGLARRRCLVLGLARRLFRLRRLLGLGFLVLGRRRQGGAGPGASAVRLERDARPIWLELKSGDLGFIEIDRERAARRKPSAAHQHVA
ncbi:MAG: hypothetical protein QGF53_06775, partial [Alphaproteobacteria bacterium]|nr:hypothetical protein [Alphaproteobacteria bacterium]